MYVFKVQIWYEEDELDTLPSTVLNVVADNDVQARAKAIKIDDRIERECNENPRPTKKRIKFCSIVPICELSE
jgi:hypothetical protein